MSEIQLNKVNLDAYTQIGEGGNGKTYVNPTAPGEILKVNNAHMSTWEAVKREYDISRAVADLGIAVPATYRFAALDVILRTIFQKPNFVEKLFFGNYVRKLMKQYYS